VFQWEAAGSLRSKPAEKQHRLTPTLPD